MNTQRMATAAGVSREAVLSRLRSHPGALAIEALAEQVGLSVNTVRFHLDRLHKEGLITRERVAPDGPGRPRMLYRAFAPEAVDGAAAYRLLAGLLAAGLIRTGDTSATIAAGRAWADREIPERDPSVGGSAEADANRGAIHRIVELFEEGGFAPQHLQAESSIALHRCPFIELASVRADVVCAVHLGFVQQVLQRLREVALNQGRRAHQIEADTVQLIPVLDGSGPCLVRLPSPRIRPDGG